MATNPMQNSMLLGIVIGLLIGCVIIAFLFIQLTNLQKQIKYNQETARQVYVLKNDIKSGSNITQNDIELVSAIQDVVPTDYIKLSDITENTIAKLDLTKGLVLSKSMIQKSDEKITPDLRQQQYNMIVLPQYLDVDSYIDIRLMLPNGQDYIVVSKKLVKQISEDTIWLDLYEQETLAMSNAIVEAYIMKGSKLYATTYVEPGTQTSAIPTYVPSANVINLMNANSNITQEAKQGLAERYTQELRLRREQDINAQVNAVRESAQTNLETSIQQEITKSKEARKQYLDELEALNNGNVQ